MSAQSVQRIVDTFTPKVEEECRVGRGEQLWLDYVRALAVDLADSVFLRMDAVVSKATPADTDGDELLKWAENYPYAKGLDLLESVETSLRAYNASDDQVRVAVEATATAYRERLDSHMGGPAGGASAS